MAYLIQSVSGEDEKQKNFLVQNKKITYISKNKHRFKHMKVDCSGFRIGPGRVGIDFSIMDIEDSDVYKKRCMDWHNRGCTTVLVVCSVSLEKQVRAKLKKARHQMINSSLDYVVGVSFPMKKLTPSFIRTCKRERVPFIMVSLGDKSDMENAAWSWTRQALLPYDPVIIPDFESIRIPEREYQKIWKKWRNIVDRHHLKTLETQPHDQEILNKNTLRKVGIAPFKGELRVGADLDYTLYQNDSLANDRVFHYDKQRIPDIVVAKGKIVKAGVNRFFYPGIGREILVHTPSYLTTYECL